eukprot:c15538_g1_i1.p1 GENE.c15538_g1_i1~~c15538_g1_i1.p1  ORF type:complete len:177 (+),score=48.64 c15538_g1_i1:52-531(+)
MNEKKNIDSSEHKQISGFINNRNKHGSNERIKLKWSNSVLPPKPTHKCNEKLQNIIKDSIEKKGKGCVLRSLHKSNLFSNPYLLENQANLLEIDERGTLFSVWQSEFDDSCFYHRLASVQVKAEESFREQQSKRSRISFVSSTENSNFLTKNVSSSEWN